VVALLLIVVLSLVGACDLAGDAQGNPAGPSLALLGDSITVRATPSLHTALDPEYRVRLGAEVGMTFADMQETARTLGADRPRSVVALGTNDVWNGVRRRSRPPSWTSSSATSDGVPGVGEDRPGRVPRSPTTACVR
jgi:hypothetical protein